MVRVSVHRLILRLFRNKKVKNKKIILNRVQNKDACAAPVQVRFNGTLKVDIQALISEQVIQIEYQH